MVPKPRAVSANKTAGVKIETMENLKKTIIILEN
jgi:hypothetical protein